MAKKERKEERKKKEKSKQINKGKARAVIAWETRRHLATPLSLPNDAWETSAEIPHWWRVTTQLWVLLLIGRVPWEICFNQLEAEPRCVIILEFPRSFLRRHFAWKPLVASQNVACFLRLALWLASWLSTTRRITLIKAHIGESRATSSKTLEMRKRTIEITTCFVAPVTSGNIDEEEEMEYTRKPKFLQIVKQSTSFRIFSIDVNKKNF